MSGHHHRSVLSQTHKPFKGGRHASKGSLKAASKGRMDSTTSSLERPHKSVAALPNAADRRNAAKQHQRQKREGLLQATRIFSRSTGRAAGGATKDNAPRVVVFASLSRDVDAWAAVKELEAEGEEQGVKMVGGGSKEAKGRMCELELTRHKTTLQLHAPAYGNLYALLDLAQCADFVILLLSSSESIEPGSWGEVALRILQSQGLPTVLAAVPTLVPADEAAGMKAGAKLRAANGARASLLSFARYFAPSLERVHALDEHAERAALLRTLATCTPRRVAWRDGRAWGVAEDAEWTPSSSIVDANAGGADAATTTGTLSITTHIRGAPLSAQRLVHLPDFGDFIVRRIVACPREGTRKARKGQDVEMGSAEEEVLDEREEGYADELVAENEPDEMDGEQTWPTEAELAAAQAGAAGAKEGVRFAQHDEESLPPAAPGTTPLAISKATAKGNKEERERKRFQAAWIMEASDDEEDSQASADEDGDEAMATDDVVGSTAPMEEEEDDEAASAYQDEDDEADYAAYQALREEERQRRNADDEDAKFPDEVDTPMHIPARQRFARFRGLRSFRHSTWDPYEDLPIDYARIFQFDDYRRTRRRVEGEALEEGVAPGQRVKVVLEDVPVEAARRAGALGGGRQDGFVLFGLLRHEHKMSVINFSVSRNTEYDAPVRSKDPLVLCLGPRRFRVNPIFSQHDPGNNGGRGTNNIHRFERFLRGGPGATSVGTVFAPITFGGANVPAVLLRERALDGETGHDERGVGAAQMPHLVGSGSLLDAGPTRINAKRIVLTGHPFKVHKRTATIRWMFFNSNDVHYFKPVELTTKYGKTGHIKESLGTHGYFKAHFSQPITQMDTIMMPLYKRVFPKWSKLFTSAADELPLAVDGAAASSSAAVGNAERIDYMEV